MEQLTTAGGALTAVRTGAGPDLVILHSLLTDRTAFDAVVPRLASRYRVTLVNLPGFHGSRPVAGTIEAYVGRIADAFDGFAIAPDATLMGNGLGGTVGLAFALDHQERLSRLVLADVTAGFPPAGKEAFRAMAGRVRAGGMGSIADVAAARVYHTAYVAQYPHVIDERRAVLLGIDPSAFIAACEVLVDCDLTPRLSTLDTPTLVTFGALDQATPPALNGIIASSVRNARLVEIPDCGHCPPLERPDAFLAVLGAFLAL